MTRPLILLDCDGVLADFVGLYLDTVTESLGIRHGREDVTEWEIDRVLKLSAKEAREVHDRVKKPGWCAGIPVISGAVDGVAALREVADVHVVTSPWDSLTWAGERSAWLRRHFGFSRDEVTHTSQKRLVCGDTLVDDRYSSCEEWSRTHARWAALWDTPHNRRDDDRDEDQSAKVYRCSSWQVLKRNVLNSADRNSDPR